jgi:hypothetical protein
LLRRLCFVLLIQRYSNNRSFGVTIQPIFRRLEKFN